MNNFVKECSSNGLSIVAIDIANNRLAGVFFNKDYSICIPWPTIDNLMERLISALFDRLWNELEHPLKEVSDKKGQVLDLMVIGVDGKYIGRKIGSRLC